VPVRHLGAVLCPETLWHGPRGDLALGLQHLKPPEATLYPCVLGPVSAWGEALLPAGTKVLLSVRHGAAS
jgi:hypothetical protein